MAGFGDAEAALERFAASARAGGAAAAANAMAGRFVDHEQKVTLNRSTHARGSRGAAPRGSPPARVSGWLAASFQIDRAAPGGDSASALAGPTAIYSRLQELGGGITKDPGFMHWVDYGGPQYRHFVYVGPHPYMRPGVEAVIADGSLRAAAAEAFAAATGQ